MLSSWQVVRGGCCCALGARDRERVSLRTGACPQQQGSAGGEPTGLERLAVLTVATLREHAYDVISWETFPPVVEDTTVDGYVTTTRYSSVIKTKSCFRLLDPVSYTWINPSAALKTFSMEIFIELFSYFKTRLNLCLGNLMFMLETQYSLIVALAIFTKAFPELKFTTVLLLHNPPVVVEVAAKVPYGF